MNLYHCMITLRHEAKALAFAHALDKWMTHLAEAGMIGAWRLVRRKLNLSSDQHRDFILLVEVSDLAQLDRMFRHVCSQSDEVEALYSKVHQMIDTAEFGLFRDFPDPERVERAALL